MHSSTIYRGQRELLKLSLREIARRTGINPGRLSIIERGFPPTDDEHRAILAALAAPTVKE